MVHPPGGSLFPPKAAKVYDPHVGLRFFFQTKMVDSPVGIWTFIVDRPSDIPFDLVDKRETGEDFFESRRG